MDELPKGAERRLVLQLLAYWREIGRDGSFPHFSSLDPTVMGELWRHCFALDLSGGIEDPVFRMAGEEFAGYADCGFTNLSISRVPSDTLVHHAISYYGEVIDREAPVSRGGEFIRPDGVRILYRSILLPMADDGQNITGLLGAANCREIAADADYDDAEELVDHEVL